MSHQKSLNKSCAMPGMEDVLSGPCCACGRVGDSLRNVLCLPFRAPVADGEVRIGGWGCALCHLPSEGAVAFVCDPCMEAVAAAGYDATHVKKYVLGDPRDGRRGLISDLCEPWGHDMTKHTA